MHTQDYDSYESAYTYSAQPRRDYARSTGGRANADRFQVCQIGTGVVASAPTYEAALARAHECARPPLSMTGLSVVDVSTGDVLWTDITRRG